MQKIIAEGFESRLRGSELDVGQWELASSMMNIEPIFLRISLQLDTYANIAALQTALFRWCYSSRNFGASPTVSAGNGTGADDDNRVQVDPLKKGKGKGKGKHPKQKGSRPSFTSNTSNTDINTCKNCGRTEQ